MIQASTRGAGKSNLAKALRNRLPFKTSGALKGVAGRVGVFGVAGLGRLNKYEREMYRADDVVYTVVSVDLKKNSGRIIMDRKLSGAVDGLDYDVNSLYLRSVWNYND